MQRKQSEHIFKGHVWVTDNLGVFMSLLFASSSFKFCLWWFAGVISMFVLDVACFAVIGVKIMFLFWLYH